MLQPAGGSATFHVRVGYTTVEPQLLGMAARSTDAHNVLMLESLNATVKTTIMTMPMMMAVIVLTVIICTMLIMMMMMMMMMMAMTMVMFLVSATV